MENNFDYMKHGNNSLWKPFRRSEEFQEEDVWGVIMEENRVGFKIDEPKIVTSSRSLSRRLPSAARMISGARKHQHHGNEEPELLQHSAPVNIPDWSKIYGRSPRWNDVSSSSSPHDNDYDAVVQGGVGESDEDDDEDDYDGDERLPPHEWLAKKLARSRISSFSVCEGAGRTLKGRDLSRVRDAVLSKTGFL